MMNLNNSLGVVYFVNDIDVDIIMFKFRNINTNNCICIDRGEYK